MITEEAEQPLTQSPSLTKIVNIYAQPRIFIRDIDLDFKNYKGYNDKVANLFKKVKIKKI
jgi:hypothetical protein